MPENVTVEVNPVVQDLKFRPDAVRAVRRAIRERGLFRAPNLEAKKDILQELGVQIIAAYNVGRGTPERPAIPGFRLEFVQGRAQDTEVPRVSGAGCYFNTPNGEAYIIMDRPSLVTFLHELGHHIQTKRDGSTTERFARGFAIGLYRRATPNLFAAAARAGRILFVDPATFDTPVNDPLPEAGTQAEEAQAVQES